MTFIHQKLTKLYFKLKPLFSNKKFLIVGLIVIGIGILLPHYAYAQERVAWGALGYIFYAIAGLFMGLIKIVGEILQWGLEGTHGFLQTSVITEGWSVVRDTANMFFILILLYIAFATILRIEQYTYRRMLVPMILAILLVNFSRTICGIYIGFADTLMSGFLGGITGAGAEGIPEAITRGAGIDELYQVAEGKLAMTGIELKMLLAIMFIALYAFIVFVALMAISAFLVVRTLLLGLLMIVSPLAFVLPIIPIPAIKRWHEEWWKVFTGITLYGPVAAFCVALAGKLSMEVFEGNWEVTEDVSKVKPVFLSQLSSSGRILEGLLVCGILFGAVLAGQQLGMVGASAIISGAKRAGADVPRQLGRWAGGALAAGRRGLPGRALIGIQKAVGRIPGVKKALPYEVTPEGEVRARPGARKFASGVRKIMNKMKTEPAYKDALAKRTEEDKSPEELREQLNREFKEGASRNDKMATMTKLAHKDPGLLGKAIAEDEPLKNNIPEAMRKKVEETKQLTPEAMSGWISKTFGDRASEARTYLGDVSRKNKDLTYSDIGKYVEGRNVARTSPEDFEEAAKKKIDAIEKMDSRDRSKVSPTIFINVDVAKGFRERGLDDKDLNDAARRQLRTTLGEPLKEAAEGAAAPETPAAPVTPKVIVSPGEGGRKTPEEIKEAGKIREARKETRGRIEGRKKAGMREREGMPSE